MPAHAVPIASARPDQNPRAVASQPGPEGPCPTGARWRAQGCFELFFQNAAGKTTLPTKRKKKIAVLTKLLCDDYELNINPPTPCQ